MSFKIIFPIFIACFSFPFKKSILKDFLSLWLRQRGPSSLGKRGGGRKTMYEIIVQVPAFGPSNNYAPSGSPLGGAASPAGTGRPRCLLQGEDMQHCLDQSGCIDDGVGMGKLNSNIATRCWLFRVLRGHFSSAGQVENTATGVTLGKVKEILKGLWVGGNWCFTKVSPSIGPNDRKKP